MIREVLAVEFIKAFSRWRTYIGPITVALLVPIVVVAMGAEGMEYFSFATQQLQEMFEFTGNLMNGYTVSYILLGMLHVHIPFLVTLVAGDILAGEATAGTYRLLFIRPVSRSAIVVAKYVVSSFYAILLIVWLGCLSLGLGYLILGSGEVVVLRSTITILASHDALWRFVSAYMLAAIAMVTVSSIAFLLSALVENSIGPIMSTMALIIVFTIISAINSEFIHSLRPFLFTNHMAVWREMFELIVDWDAVRNSSLVLVGHSLTCFLAALAIMRRKDILT